MCTPDQIQLQASVSMFFKLLLLLSGSTSITSNTPSIPPTVLILPLSLPPCCCKAQTHTLCNVPFHQNTHFYAYLLSPSILCYSVGHYSFSPAVFPSVSLEIAKSGAADILRRHASLQLLQRHNLLQNTEDYSFSLQFHTGSGNF